MAREAKTFAEYVDTIATNSPDAAIMDWGRRLDRSVDGYYERIGRPRPSKARHVESDVAADPLLGPEAAALLRDLRRKRNRVVHEDVGPIGQDDAIEYARQAHRLGWVLAAGGSFAALEPLPIE